MIPRIPNRPPGGQSLSSPERASAALAFVDTPQVAGCQWQCSYHVEACLVHFEGRPGRHGAHGHGHCGGLCPRLALRLRLRLESASES
jgi:hypothetical protein